MYTCALVHTLWYIHLIRATTFFFFSTAFNPYSLPKGRTIRWKIRCCDDKWKQFPPRRGNIELSDDFSKRGETVTNGRHGGLSFIKRNSADATLLSIRSENQFPRHARFQSDPSPYFYQVLNLEYLLRQTLYISRFIFLHSTPKVQRGPRPKMCRPGSLMQALFKVYSNNFTDK